MKKTMEEAGYKLIRRDTTTSEYLLQNIETKKLEWWTANKNHASYGIIHRNTHLEFVRSANSNEAPF